MEWEFLRVLRSHEIEPITDAGALIAPDPLRLLPIGVQGPLVPENFKPIDASDPPEAGGNGNG